MNEMMLFPLLAFLVGLGLGYVARKYVEKKWPAKAQEVDDKANLYAAIIKEKLDKGG